MTLVLDIIAVFIYPISFIAGVVLLTCIECLEEKEDENV